MKKITPWQLAIFLTVGMSLPTQARYYDAGAGRFITPDTIVQSPYDPQTLNRYSYVRNNPINLTDPTGHSFFGSVGGFFNDIGKTIGQEHGAGFLLGPIGFIPQVNSFTFQNRYYITAVAVTAVTAGAAAPAIGSVLAGTGGTLGLTGAVEIGALAGEITGGVSAGLHGDSGKAILSSTLEQGALGAGTSAISFGIAQGVSTEVGNSVFGASGFASKGIQAGLDLGLIGSVGGAKGVLLEHQSFWQGFEGGASNAALSGITNYELGMHPLLSIPQAESGFGTVWPNASVNASTNLPLDRW